MPVDSRKQAVLILSPHPDDESLGCGGTIKLLTESGARVDVAYCTRGELGTATPEQATPAVRERLAEVRTEEARAACRCLGVHEVVFFDGRDGMLSQDRHLGEVLLRRLQRERYGRVFCPWPQEKHPDHAATFGLLRSALQHYPEPIHVWLYEVWTPLIPSVCVPIDSTVDAKVAAIRAHQSQLACIDYLSAFQGLAAYRALGCPGAPLAEAFLTGGRELVVG